jgi:hypothetical protein
MKGWILFLLACIGGLFFLVGIVVAGILSHKGKPEQMPSYFKESVTLMGGVLATNFGAFLGITVSRGQLPSLRFWTAPPIEAFQISAVILYIVGLLVALFYWSLGGLKENPNEGPIVVVSTLPELSRTFMGIVAGALVVVLGN